MGRADRYPGQLQQGAADINQRAKEICPGMDPGQAEGAAMVVQIATHPAQDGLALDGDPVLRVKAAELEGAGGHLLAAPAVAGHGQQGRP